jgi:tRNA C32,U32 (ribose-2'-O)-methylase TrmJ
MQQGVLPVGELRVQKRASEGEQRTTAIDRRLHVRKVASKTAAPAPVSARAPALGDVRVVLIGTKMPVTLGMVARAAASFEVGSLVFVAPRCNPLQPTAMRASKGALQHSFSEDRLSWVVADTLEEALRGCKYVCGMTRLDAVEGLSQKKLHGMRELCGLLEDLRRLGDGTSERGQGAREAAQENPQKGGTLALVFGREDTGFEEQELQADCFDHWCEILMSDQWGTESLSLSQAVPIVLARLFEDAQLRQVEHHADSSS